MGEEKISGGFSQKCLVSLLSGSAARGMLDNAMPGPPPVLLLTPLRRHGPRAPRGEASDLAVAPSPLSRPNPSRRTRNPSAMVHRRSLSGSPRPAGKETVVLQKPPWGISSLCFLLFLPQKNAVLPHQMNSIFVQTL